MIAKVQDGLVTKHDLIETKNEIKADMNVRFERIDGELKLNRWMLGVLLAGVISLVLKAFFLTLPKRILRAFSRLDYIHSSYLFHE
ncbi:MAG: hypothetical protein ABL919_09520 [Methylococcales bacterium]